MKSEDIRSVADLIQTVQSGKRVKYVHFWGHTKRVDGQVTKACFSQWYGSKFEENGITYPTAVHYMMAEKARLFGDPEQLEKILQAKSPGAAKAEGRNVKGFDQDIWVQKRFDIVAQANTLKFGQDTNIGDFLLATNTRVLVEASPRDRIWGIGLQKTHDHAEVPQKWRGLNLLGFALMEARSRLNQNRT